jgi:peptide/nickel transport system permease protein
MLQLILRRVVVGILLVLASSFVVFLLVINAGEPSQLQVLRERPNHSELAVQQLEHQYGLDQPWNERYVTWISGAVHGDFGDDQHGRPVGPQVRAGLAVTLRLVLAAELLAVLVGVSAGVVSAVRQYRVVDHVTTGLGFLFFAMPVFWFAILLKEFGAVRLNRVLEPLGIDHAIKTIGSETPGFRGTLPERVWDWTGYTVLPVVTLTAVSFVALSRFQRSAMLEVLGADHIVAARAKGISERRVIVRHALRVALVPVTTLVALDFGALFGGAVVTERVFGWRGMGALFLDAVTDVDPNMLLCWLLVTATSVVVFNLLADIAYAYLDPRVRRG